MALDNAEFSLLRGRESQPAQPSSNNKSETEQTNATEVSELKTKEDNACSFLNVWYRCFEKTKTQNTTYTTIGLTYKAWACQERKRTLHLGQSPGSATGEAK